MTKIRQARAEDTPQIVQLLQINELPISDIAAPEIDFQVLALAGAVVACGALERLDNACLLRSLAVDQAHRKKGYASQLCGHLIQRATTQGYGDIFLLTTDAAGYFTRHGFARTDRHRAPQVIQQSRQFSQLCPGSAVVMKCCQGIDKYTASPV